MVMNFFLLVGFLLLAAAAQILITGWMWKG